MVLSYSAQIGSMLLLTAGEGWIVGLFLMGAFAFLSFKRGFGTLLTLMVLFPVAVGIVAGGWLPKSLIGFALLGMGVLWAAALIKIMGTSLEGSDIQKIVLTIMMWNLALGLSDFGVTASTVNAIPLSGDFIGGLVFTLGTIISTIYVLLLGGALLSFIAQSGLEQVYVTAITGILTVVGFFAVYPLLIKLATLIASIGIWGWAKIAGVAIVAAITLPTLSSLIGI